MILNADWAAPTIKWAEQSVAMVKRAQRVTAQDFAKIYINITDYYSYLIDVTYDSRVLLLLMPRVRIPVHWRMAAQFEEENNRLQPHRLFRRGSFDLLKLFASFELGGIRLGCFR